MRAEIVRDPIYCQVNDLLRTMLQEPGFPAGARFLTERQISERFEISRATANKALSTLVAEGLLEFRKGVGTFVAEQRLDYDLRSLVSFTAKARAAGKTPATQTLQLSAATTADEDIAVALDVAARESLYYMERLRLADGLPVILEKRYLCARYCPGLDAAMLEGSIYELLSDRYKLTIAGADETIRAVAIRGADAGLLRVPEGEAGLLVTAIGYLSGGIPLWHERTLYRGDAYEFRNRLGPITSARPAMGALR